MITIRPETRVLLSAASGLEMAEKLLAALTAEQAAVLDLETVESMSPSFVNALVMTLLESVPREVLRARLSVRNTRSGVIRAINRSIERYDDGVRLSTQAISA